jgi:cytochrome c
MFDRYENAAYLRAAGPDVRCYSCCLSAQNEAAHEIAIVAISITYRNNKSRKRKVISAQFSSQLVGELFLFRVIFRY